LQWHQTEAMRLAAEARDKIFDQRMEKIVTSIEKLVTVMESHERRIDNLESGDA
jgi:hypothetical protein